MTLAADSQGRIIHQSFDITMIPPQVGEPGHTDMAYEIGKGLIREAVEIIRAAAEKEGFKVEIEYGQVVY